MDVTITESDVTGTARAPPSKSYTHRAIFAGGYSSGVRINEPLRSADTAASIAAVDAFDGEVTEDGNTLEVVGFEGTPAVPADVLDCAGSATTLRHAAAAAALTDGITVLTGDRPVRARPQEPILDAITGLGGRAESTRANGRAPLVIDGVIDGGTISFPSDVSAQFVTPFMLAGPITADGIRIDVEDGIEEQTHVAITTDLLEEFGITVEESGGTIRVPGGQYYEPTDGEYSVPSDFASASYLLAAGALAADGEVRIRGAYPSAGKETAIVDVLETMGGDVEWRRADGQLVVRRTALDGAVVDVSEAPDLVPTVAALGSVADGTTQIEHATAGRYKTAGRAAAMAEELSRLGVDAGVDGDALVIRGGESALMGATVDGRSDHRIVMALAVLALAADGETTIRNADHVDASFPAFFDVLYDLGATVRR